MADFLGVAVGARRPASLIARRSAVRSLTPARSPIPVILVRRKLILVILALAMLDMDIVDIEHRPI